MSEVKLILTKDLSYGSANASYSLEGGWNADGKSEIIWDRLSHIRSKVDIGNRGNALVTITTAGEVMWS